MNFEKNFYRYDDNACIQKKVAKKLKSFLDKSKYSKILELGCGTGIFTKELIKDITIEKLYLNDYFDTQKYLENINYFKFMNKDMTLIDYELLGKMDLIVSSSAFQWIENLENLISKLSNMTNELVFSIYLKENMIEIQKHFNIGLKYWNSKDLKEMLNRYFISVEYFEEVHVLSFENSRELLRHIKNTGVTGIGKSSYSQIKSFSSKELTYHVGYFKCIKK